MPKTRKYHVRVQQKWFLGYLKFRVFETKSNKFFIFDKGDIHETILLPFDRNITFIRLKTLCVFNHLIFNFRSEIDKILNRNTVNANQNFRSLFHNNIIFLLVFEKPFLIFCNVILMLFIMKIQNKFFMIFYNVSQLHGFFKNFRKFFSIFESFLIYKLPENSNL